MSTYGPREIFDAIAAAAHPLYGAEEEARWQQHRAEVMARALGVSLSEGDYQGSGLERFQRLLKLARHRTPHPLAGYLEAGLVEMRHGHALEPIHEVARALDALYAAEIEALLTALYGEVSVVDEAELEAAGLDRSLEPDWDRIYDEL